MITRRSFPRQRILDMAAFAPLPYRRANRQNRRWDWRRDIAGLETKNSNALAENPGNALLWL
jgi:hypothetical protein